MRKIGGAALAASMLLLAPAAGAQQTAAEGGGPGFAMGIQLLSSFIGAEDRPANPPAGAVYVDDVAAGLQLWGGYAFSRSFLLRFSVGGASHPTDNPDVNVQVTSAMIEAEYHLIGGGRLRPYLLGGFGGYTLRSLNDPFEFKTEGGAIDVGAGVDYFVSRHVSFDLSARADFINWNKATATMKVHGGEVVVDQPVDDNGTAAKILFGLGIWF